MGKKNKKKKQQRRSQHASPPALGVLGDPLKQRRQKAMSAVSAPAVPDHQIAAELLAPNRKTPRKRRRGEDFLRKKGGETENAGFAPSTLVLNASDDRNGEGANGFKGRLGQELFGALEEAQFEREMEFRREKRQKLAERIQLDSKKVSGNYFQILSNSTSDEEDLEDDSNQVMFFAPSTLHINKTGRIEPIFSDPTSNTSKLKSLKLN